MLTIKDALERQRKVEALIAEDRPVRLRIRTSIASRDFSYRPGQVVDVERRVARQLIAGGNAVQAPDEPLTVRPETCCGGALQFFHQVEAWMCTNCGKSWS